MYEKHYHTIMIGAWILLWLYFIPSALCYLRLPLTGLTHNDGMCHAHINDFIQLLSEILSQEDTRADKIGS